MAAYLTGYHQFDGVVSIDGGKYAETTIDQDLRLLSIRISEEGWDPPDEADLVRHRCCIAAAGYAAELVLAERSDRSFSAEAVRLGALGDRRHVLDLWGPGDAFYKFADEMAVLFREPLIWQMLGVVATELHRRGRMPADELLWLVEDVRMRLKVPYRLYSSLDPALQTPAPRAPG